MKRCVTISLQIDPEDYHDGKDSASGAIELVAACLRDEADFPDKLTVACEGNTVWLFKGQAVEGQDQ